ncbi:MAG: carboxypeptidase-like regulatory domain-containing protein [Planctomycetota bacterium]|jgi:hypothetical protein
MVGDRDEQRFVGIGPAAAVDAPAETYTISGNINDAAGADLSGVTVTLSGDDSDSTTTDVNGDYSFADLPNGDYTVTPSKTGILAWDPADSDETIADGNVTVDDFDALAYPQNLNFEDDDDAEADFSGLSANWGDETISVRASDYASLFTMSPENLTQCYFSHRATAGSAGLRWVTGKAIDMATGTVWMESMHCVEGGVNALFAHRCWDSTVNDGLEFKLIDNDLEIRTYGGGSGTTKATESNIITSTPIGVCWAIIQSKFNFATLAYSVRVVEFGAAATEDSGWQSGSISGPTYNNALDITAPDAYSHSGTSADIDVGIAQVWISDGVVAHPDGALVENTVTKR